MPQEKEKVKRKKEKVRMKIVLIKSGFGLTFSFFLLTFLEDVSAEVLILNGLGEHAVNIGGVYALLLRF